MGKKCKYNRNSPNETYEPSCQLDLVGEDGVFYDVHPIDCEEWVFCPFCGREIKYKEGEKC